LLALGPREFREIFFKPYRVICRLIGKQVFVYLIAEGRRYMRTLFTRWLL
jgi:toxin ParE1/3/4